MHSMAHERVRVEKHAAPSSSFFAVFDDRRDPRKTAAFLSRSTSDA